MHDDDDAKAILKRRARYVAMALAGLGTATHAAACVCLSPLYDAGDPYADANIDAERPSTRIDVGDPAPDASLDAATLEDSRDLDAALDDIDAPSPEDAADDAHIVDANVDTDAEDAP